MHKLVTTFPTISTPQGYLAEAIELAKQQQYDDALKLLDKAQRQLGVDSRNNILLAKIYLERSKLYLQFGSKNNQESYSELAVEDAIEAVILEPECTGLKEHINTLMKRYRLLTSNSLLIGVYYFYKNNISALINTFLTTKSEEYVTFTNNYTLAMKCYNYAQKVTLHHACASSLLIDLYEQGLKLHKDIYQDYNHLSYDIFTMFGAFQFKFDLIPAMRDLLKAIVVGVNPSIILNSYYTLVPQNPELTDFDNILWLQLHFLQSLLMLDADRLSLKAPSFNHLAAAILYKKYELLENCTINGKNEQGFTLMHVAAMLNDVTAAKILYSRGHAVDDAATDRRLSPLFLAAYNNHPEMVRFLRRHGANLNQQTQDGLTPLHIAAYYGYIKCAEYLLLSPKIELDIAAAGHSDKTPLHLAVERGYIASVKMLIAHGAAVNRVTKEGINPLSLAARNQHLSIIEFLVEQLKVALDKTDHAGNTALHHAAQVNENEPVCKYLIEMDTVACLAGKQQQSILTMRNQAGDTPQDEYDKLSLPMTLNLFDMAQYQANSQQQLEDAYHDYLIRTFSQASRTVFADNSFFYRKSKPYNDCLVICKNDEQEKVNKSLRAAK